MAHAAVSEVLKEKELDLFVVDGLPGVAKTYIYRRFWEVLSGKDNSKLFEHLSPEDRKAILEILQETKPDFAAFVKQLG